MLAFELDNTELENTEEEEDKRAEWLRGLDIGAEASSASPLFILLFLSMKSSCDCSKDSLIILDIDVEGLLMILFTLAICKLSMNESGMVRIRKDIIFATGRRE